MIILIIIIIMVASFIGHIKTKEAMGSVMPRSQKTITNCYKCRTNDLTLAVGFFFHHKYWFRVRDAIVLYVRFGVRGRGRVNIWFRVKVRDLVGEGKSTESSNCGS